MNKSWCKVCREYSRHWKISLRRRQAEKEGWETHLNRLKREQTTLWLDGSSKNNRTHQQQTDNVTFQSALTNAQQNVAQMSQVEIGKKVNEIEGHKWEADDNT